MKRLLSIMLLSLLCVGSFAQQRTDIEAKKEKLLKEIEILDAQLKANAKSSSDALGKLNVVNRKVLSRKALLAQSDRQINELDAKIRNKKEEVDRIQERLDTMEYYYGRLVKNAYKNRDPRIWYMHLLSGGDLGQIMRRYIYLKDLSSKLEIQAKKINVAKAELEVEVQQLQKMLSDARKLRASRADELSKLKKDEASVRSTISLLKRDKSKYQKELKKKRSQMEALNRQVNKIISASKTKVDTKLSREFESNRGRLPWPAEGVVVDHFGQHYHPVYKSVKLPFNNGITIAVQSGTKAKAVFGGVVKQVIVMPGYSHCVLLQHGSYFTFYCKLGSVAVKAGQNVQVGQTLGTVDSIGSETQLHFQLWKDKTPQDPESWLK